MNKMKPYYESERGKLYHGDCLEVMRKLPSEVMQAAWTQALIKGSIFFIDKTKYTVTVHTKKTFRVKNENGVNYTFKIYGGQFAAKGKEANLLRDAESLLIVDLINYKNPFHIPSDIFNLTIETIEKILRNSR